MHRSRAFRSRFPLVGAATLLAASCVGGDAAPGDAAGARSLGPPDAVFPEDFGTIQTVRELADGRVLVADPLGNALYVVDLDAGTRTALGAQGEGPGEYRQPDSVWPLPGGATLLVDLGNGRTTAIGPDLGLGETAPIAMGEPRPGSTLVLALPQGVDGEGRVYARAMGGGFGGPAADSAAILRIDRATAEVDTVARFKLPEVVRTESGDGGERSVRIRQIPLSGEDAWGVAADGSVVVARAADYRIEWIAPDGTVTTGPPTSHDPIPIGTGEKEEWVAASGRTGGGIGISVAVGDGVMEMSFARGGPGSRRREIDSYSWPEVKPPFYSGRLDVDPAGRVWVRRHVEAGGDATYDVFDRAGERVGTVTLPNDRRVIGFGAESVYVVAYDEVDLNYLERYALPTL